MGTQNQAPKPTNVRRNSDPNEATEVSLAQAWKSPKSQLPWIILTIIGILAGVVMFYLQNKNSTLRGSGPTVQETENAPTSLRTVETNTPAPSSESNFNENNSPERTLSAPNSRSPFREFNMWARDTKQKASEEVRQHWNNMSQLEEKRNNPELYISKLENMSKGEINKLLEELNKFKELYELQSNDVERVKIINQFAEALKSAPLPRRRNSN